MKRLITIFLLLIVINLSKAQCPIGDVVFASQAQIDSFAIDFPAWKKIEGSLILDPAYVTIEATFDLSRND